MDPDALKVINRLNRHGYRSFLVGGCVRDMLLGRRPKDFDVVTSATPQQVKRVFSNSRLIGRRFRIVHVVFRGGKVIEVSTFRSLPGHRLDKKSRKADLMMKRDNEYGNAREDAARRDFTVNALFFDPRNESLIDYVGGFDDLQARRIAVIGDADMSFQEDPVRMFRAAKFAATLDFNLDSAVAKAIRRNKDEIAKASPSRMIEEYYKIFRTGKTAVVLRSLAETGLLKALVPEVWAAGVRASGETDFFSTDLGRRLEIADRMLSEREELTANIYLALIVADLVKNVFSGGKIKNLMEYVKHNLDGAMQRMQIPGRDRDRLLQIFISQVRFVDGERTSRSRNEHFRAKNFFYEAFVVFKIHALARGDDDALDRAMFWEIGPRARPPESSRVISLFTHRPRPRDIEEGEAAGGERPGRGGRDREGREVREGRRRRGSRPRRPGSEGAGHERPAREGTEGARERPSENAESHGEEAGAEE